MDRNHNLNLDWILETLSLSARRAWIEIKSRLKVAEMVLSLSARRAWIEILVVGGSVRAGAVALRKESVDRNHAIQHIITEGFESLSARRAWIEIRDPARGSSDTICRSPQGERG